MGLTIHYDITSSLKTPPIEAMRELALDLPFENVGPIQDVRGKNCDFEARRSELKHKDDGLFWMLIQSTKYVQCPWNKNISRQLIPNRILAFTVTPGPGSEPANIGFCHYPSEIQWEYNVRQDVRFWKNGCFSYKKHRKAGCPNETPEQRTVPTGISGWEWGSFCKTQYASDPKCGGIANFLRCHISVITLLERIAKTAGVKVRINDEGKYGPSRYSDDHREAFSAGRKPTYRMHKGKYNPAALASEVGEWNEMIAGMLSAMREVDSGETDIQSPITKFPNFEQLEFRGAKKNQSLTGFLKVLKKVIDSNKKAKQ